MPSLNRATAPDPSAAPSVAPLMDTGTHGSRWRAVAIRSSVWPLLPLREMNEHPPSLPSTTIGPAIVSVESAPGLPRARSVERVSRTDAARVAPASLRTPLSSTAVEAGATSSVPEGMPPAPLR